MSSATLFKPGACRRALIAAITALGLVASAPAQSLAQAAPFEPQASTIKVELGGTGPASRALSLPRGKSAIIDLPVDARDVLVSNPAVADAVLRTNRRIYVMGIAPGQTDAVFFDAAGRQILSLDIRVDQPTGALEDTLRRLVPGATIHVEPIADSLALTGSVASPSESERIQKIAERFVAKPDQVINMLSIRGAEQVTLKVRVVEMQRTMIKQLGFNTAAILHQVGQPQFLLGNAPSFGVNGGPLGAFSSGFSQDTTTQAVLPGGTDCSTQSNIISSANPANCVATGRAGSTGLNKGIATVQAFERAGLVRTLAEPNLTAISGETGKFLAGGEFPVPTGLDQNGNVTVQFKPFGVALTYTPIVLSDGRISLRLATEVSELTTDGALKFNNSLTIPALSVRRAETTVEMPSGGALMIAGLLKEETKQNIDGVPGMTQLPMLGALFRSRDYLAGETELVIIVEVYTVRPTSPDKLQTPVDGLQIATDMDTIFLGRLNKTYGPNKAPAPRGSANSAAQNGAQAAAPTWQGPVGYVID
jgi:pilus assembly protein CpaC